MKKSLSQVEASPDIVRHAGFALVYRTQQIESVYFLNYLRLTDRWRVRTRTQFFCSKVKNIRNRKSLGPVYVMPVRLSSRSESTPVPSSGSVFVYMIPLENVIPDRVIPARVHPGCCTGARISFRDEISQEYPVNEGQPLVSV